MYLFKIIILPPTLKHLSRTFYFFLTISRQFVYSPKIPTKVAFLPHHQSHLSSAGVMSSRIGGTSKTLASLSSSVSSLIGWRNEFQDRRHIKDACFSVCVCVCVCVCDTKTCVYNFDPLKPHCCIVELRFIGVYIIFLISAHNIECGYALDPLRPGSSNEYLQSMFGAYQNFYLIFFLYNVVFIIIFYYYYYYYYNFCPISAQKYRLWYAFKPPRRVPTINVWSRNMKNIRIFYQTIFIFLMVNFSIYLNGHVLLVCVCVCVCVCETEILIMASVGALFLV